MHWRPSSARAHRDRPAAVGLAQNVTRSKFIKVWGGCLAVDEILRLGDEQHPVLGDVVVQSDETKRSLACGWRGAGSNFGGGQPSTGGV